METSIKQSVSNAVGNHDSPSEFITPEDKNDYFAIIEECLARSFKRYEMKGMRRTIRHGILLNISGITNLLQHLAQFASGLFPLVMMVTWCVTRIVTWQSV